MDNDAMYGDSFHEHRKAETELQELKQRVALLEKKIRRSTKEQKVIVLRTIPRKQAKEEILGLLQSMDTWYYFDIVMELKLELELVVELCQELEAEGKI